MIINLCILKQFSSETYPVNMCIWFQVSDLHAAVYQHLQHCSHCIQLHCLYQHQFTLPKQSGLIHCRANNLYELIPSFSLLLLSQLHYQYCCIYHQNQLVAGNFFTQLMDSCRCIMCRRAQSYLLPDIHLVCLQHPNLENCVVSINVLVKHMVILKSRTETTVSQ